MRFLIIFAAALACASAAPSHLLPYAAYTAIPAIRIGALPTVSSGDIQAAVIDAHVKAADIAQEYNDKARLLSEQAVENLNTQVITTVDQDKERLAHAFWTTEDKKWQALDALKTAEAQVDGAIASKADIWANTGVAVPYGAAVAPLAPAASAAPVLYGADALKSYSTQTIVQSHPETVKAEGDSEKVEAAAKAAELSKEAEAEKEKAAASDAAAELKSEADKAFAALKTSVISPVAVSGAFPYNAAYPYSGLAVGSAWAPAVAPAFARAVAPAWTSAVGPAWNSAVGPAWNSAIGPAFALTNPGFKYASTVQHVGPLATSTLLKTQC